MLTNGISVGNIDVMSDVDQKNKENLSNHQDLPDLNATNILDSEAKEGEPQCH